MAQYSWTICDPGQKDVISKGSIPEAQIMDTFLSYPWMEELERCDSLGENACYSPSVEFINDDSGESVSFSIVGDQDDYEYYIFYKSSRKGLSDITGQSMDDATAFLAAFLKDDHTWMETKMKEG